MSARCPPRASRLLLSALLVPAGWATWHVGRKTLRLARDIDALIHVDTASVLNPEGFDPSRLSQGPTTARADEFDRRA
jgi:hypothetical protein